MITNRITVLLLALAALVVPAAAVLAVQPDEVLADPKLESRAREISKDLRCLVCQNQSIDDSNAPLARDLRLVVRERLTKGDSDGAVVAYITDRYGDFARLNPPFQSNTWLLWLGPPAVLLAGVATIAQRLRARQIAKDPPALGGEEEEQLRRILGDQG
ncbi:MAG: cytochrome c-type biogenesis protein [Rhodospirillaceae bacterium]